MINIIAEIVAIKKLISKYHGYAIEKRKEDDLAIRRKLLTELSEIKKCIYDIIKKHEGMRKAAKSLDNEIEAFSKEIEYSITGHKYPFLSTPSSINMRRIKKLIEYDFFIIEKIVAIKEECCGLFKRNYADEKEYFKDFSKIRNKLIEVRNKYLDREDIIKNL